MTITLLSVPVGAIIDFAGPDNPPGYKECDGSPLSRTEYAALFEALGGTNSPWGLPDSTHFNLPDLRGRTAIGAGTGDAGGATAHVLGSRGGDERLQLHKHTMDSSGTCSISSSGNHAHNVKIRSDGTTGGKGQRIGISSSTSYVSPIDTSSGNHTHTVPNHTHTMQNAGGGSSQNMQPYATVRKLIRAA